MKNILKLLVLLRAMQTRAAQKSGLKWIEMLVLIEIGKTPEWISGVYLQNLVLGITGQKRPDGACSAALTVLLEKNAIRYRESESDRRARYWQLKDQRFYQRVHRDLLLERKKLADRIGWKLVENLEFIAGQLEEKYVAV